MPGVEVQRELGADDLMAEHHRIGIHGEALPEQVEAFQILPPEPPHESVCILIRHRDRYKPRLGHLLMSQFRFDEIGVPTALIGVGHVLLEAVADRQDARRERRPGISRSRQRGDQDPTSNDQSLHGHVTT